MTTQPAAQPGHSGAWRWGFLFGILQAALNCVVGLMLGYFLPGTSAAISSLVNTVLFGLSLLLCGCAGYIAARKSGNPYIGNSAGLYAGVIGVSIMVTLGLLLSAASSPLRQLLELDPLITVGAVGCTIVIYGLLALAAGVIEGKLAQRGMARAA